MSAEFAFAPVVAHVTRMGDEVVQAPELTAFMSLIDNGGMTGAGGAGRAGTAGAAGGTGFAGGAAGGGWTATGGDTGAAVG